MNAPLHHKERDAALLLEAQEVLQTHAKSFRFAAPLLPADQRADAAVVYALCRLIDDLADEAPSVEVADRDLAQVTRELAGASAPRPMVRAYLEIAARRGIAESVAAELITGVRSDLARVRVADDRELLRYCYRVAGTVGLMMCGVMGVKDPRALAFAIDLGLGMQLTNISRDVLEDAGRDRVYLPRTRLSAVGADPTSDERSAFPVVRDLLTLAERYYDSGLAGLRFVPLRPRLAMFVAGAIYRAIGRKLLRGGPEALTGRTYTTLAQKLVIAAVALARGVASMLRAKPTHDAALHRHLDGLPGAGAKSAALSRVQSR